MSITWEFEAGWLFQAQSRPQEILSLLKDKAEQNQTRARAK